MFDFLDVRTWSILQWVLVVLVAGFIGQFGKSFAKFIIAQVKARRSAGKTPSTLSAPAERGKITPETPSVPTWKEDIPPESSYPARDVSSAKEIIAFPKMDDAVLPSMGDVTGQRREAVEHGPSSIMSGQSTPPILDKKALKTILKQQKKAAKAAAKASK